MRPELRRLLEYAERECPSMAGMLRDIDAQLADHMLAGMHLLQARQGIIEQISETMNLTASERLILRERPF